MKEIYFNYSSLTIMPEIWVRYGTTDVAINIKFENLLRAISSNFPLLTENEIRLTLHEILLTDNIKIFPLTASKSVAKIIEVVVEMAKSKGFANVAIYALPDILDTLKIYLPTGTILCKIDSRSMDNRIKNFQNTIFISQVTYDPLFGFSGTPTILLRNFNQKQMFEAFDARQDNLPKPGVIGAPLKIALSASETIPGTSIELVSNNSGIAGIYYGNIIQAFNNAVSKLLSLSLIEVEGLAKSAIICASSEVNRTLTLADSLNSLWNSIHIVKENGSIVLVSENHKGIGGGALQKVAEGKLDIGELEKSAYMVGLEHILYIKELTSIYDLGILSTIPQYYLKTKLGFRTYNSARDILEKLLAKHGKNHKILVLSDGDITLLKSKQ
jgi:hypothetical protein